MHLTKDSAKLFLLTRPITPISTSECPLGEFCRPFMLIEKEKSTGRFNNGWEESSLMLFFAVVILHHLLRDEKVVFFSAGPLLVRGQQFCFATKKNNFTHSYSIGEETLEKIMWRLDHLKIHIL